MKKALFMSCALAIAGARAATMASQPWTTNRIAEAEARVNARITSATNAIPAPGDYANVSNRAMSALQSHQPLTPATNYTDAALGAFAATGSVARAFSCGTQTRWVDATGCVWEVVLVMGQWTRTQGPSDVYVRWHDGDDAPPYTISGAGWYIQGDYQWPQFVNNDTSATRLSDTLQNDGYYGQGVVASFVRELVPEVNLVTRVAYTNDIPDVSGYATPADVTAAIREQSLGGIWDQRLEVWWTPVMVNGALTYQATTNVNLNAEVDE